MYVLNSFLHIINQIVYFDTRFLCEIFLKYDMMVVNVHSSLGWGKGVNFKRAKTGSKFRL